MKLFLGLPKTDYQDLLRTIGHYIDQSGFTDIRLIETEEGMILQGRISPAGDIRGEKKMETYLLTVRDLQDLMREAGALRGKRL